MGTAVRWSTEELDAYKRRTAAEQPKVIAAAVKGTVVNQRIPRYRSNLEVEYAGILEMRRRAGEIREFGYERIKLRLPGDVFYTPDFDALMLDGYVELHECKGFLRESARNKLRQAIELYPGFHWFIVGASKTPTRLLNPSDVPVIGKGVR